jgi:YidC/Oxa1 family membrane protein insertase
VISFFKTTLYEPLYNALIFLIDVLPGANIGLAVIILTIIVKLILFPLSAKAIRTQLKIKEIDPELKEIKEKHKDKREEMGKAMLALYKKHKINPFSGIVLILIQLPVILSLYFVFTRAGFPSIDTSLLYSFVSEPINLNVSFLGFIDLSTNNNVILAVLAAISQYFQVKFAMPKPPESKDSSNEFADNLARTMHVQMKFVMPIITLVISFTFVSVVGLYWLVSNLFAILQEIYIRKTIKDPHAAKQQNGVL